VNACPYKKS